MAQAIISTTQPNLQRLSLASASASYATIAPTATKPTTGVIYDLNTGYPSLLRVIPFCDSSTVRTGVGMRVVGWSRLVLASGQYWFSSVLADFALTYTSGTVPNITIDTVGHFLYSGVTQVSGTPTANLYSPATAAAANVEAASVLVDCVGSTLVQLQFKASGGSAGALWYTI